MKQSEGIQDPFMRAAMVGETLRTAPARNGDSIWSDYDAMINAVQTLYQFKTQGAVVLPTLHAAVFSPGASDHLASAKVDDAEDFVNWVLRNYVNKFIFTCNCSLKYEEYLGFVLDPLTNKWKVKKYCYIWVVCAGTWSWCNFSLVIYVPCKFWWEDLPPCPPSREKMKQAMREGYDRGVPTSFVGETSWGGDPLIVEARMPAKGVVTWCDEGYNGHHPDADVCYRQVLLEEGPGQQCCYKGATLLNTGSSASTPDKVGGAVAVKSGGGCVSSLPRLLEHKEKDVDPWDENNDRMKAEAKYGPNDDDPRFNEWPPSGSATEKRLLKERDDGPWAPSR